VIGELQKALKILERIATALEEIADHMGDTGKAA
jgi:hypothetical protein